MLVHVADRAIVYLAETFRYVCEQLIEILHLIGLFLAGKQELIALMTYKSGKLA